MNTENRANQSPDGKVEVEVEVEVDERRQEPRAKTDLFVNRFLNGHPYLCRMTNISRSGACLVAVNEPKITPTPSFMGLQFQLPGRSEVVTALGEAITGSSDGPRAGRRTVGIRFTHVPASAASVIDAAVGALLSAA